MISSHSEEFSFPGGPVVASEFWFNVTEFVYVVFGVRSSSSDESHSEGSMRLLI